MQGFSVLEDFMKGIDKPGVFLLQEHWLTPANLNRFDQYFPGYFSFGCSAMTNCVEMVCCEDDPMAGLCP